MQGNWRLGSLFGIPLYIDSSWFLVLGLVTLINAQEIIRQLNDQELGGNLGLIAGIAGFGIAILMFSSVLLHELGHSIAARWQGIKVNSITLFLFGGVASIERESQNPIGALVVALAGPLVSFALFLLFSWLSGYFPENSLFGYVVGDVALINLVLTIFNLIPGLPLDGGQVLKALVWKITGDPLQGILWAASSGKFIGWIGIVAGLSLWFITGEFGGAWLGFIGWFILRNASSYERLVTLQKTLVNLNAGSAMTRDYRVVDGKLTVGEFAQQYIFDNLRTSFPFYAAADGRYCGLIQMSSLREIERSAWETTKLADIAIPLSKIASVRENTPLFELIRTLENRPEAWITVLSPADAVAGVVDKGDVVRAIANQHRLPIPEAEIQRIKAEKTYPTGLELGKIAKFLEQTGNWRNKNL